MGDLGRSPVPGADGTTEGSTPPAILDSVILRFAVLTYLVVLPVGHLFPMPINGTTVVGYGGRVQRAYLCGTGVA